MLGRLFVGRRRNVVSRGVVRDEEVREEAVFVMLVRGCGTVLGGARNRTEGLRSLRFLQIRRGSGRHFCVFGRVVAMSRADRDDRAL